MNCIIQTELSDVFSLIDQQRKNIHKISEIDSEVKKTDSGVIVFTCSNTYFGIALIRIIWFVMICVYKKSNTFKKQTQKQIMTQFFDWSPTEWSMTGSLDTTCSKFHIIYAIKKSEQISKCKIVVHIFSI